MRLRQVRGMFYLTRIAFLFFYLHYLILSTMCLITRQKKAKILKKDLIVHKFVKKDYANNILSYYQSHLWNKKQLYKVSLDPAPRLHHTKGDGVWLYTDSISHLKYEGLTQCVYITSGFHACLTVKCCKSMQEFAIHKRFLIPKGSEVYYDATGLIVSNQMMLL